MLSEYNVQFVVVTINVSDDDDDDDDFKESKGLFLSIDSLPI